MKLDELEKMAQQTAAFGVHPSGEFIYSFYTEQLQAFAALVASAEREACANACISLANKWSQMGAWGSNTEFHQCADAIRARGQA